MDAMIETNTGSRIPESGSPETEKAWLTSESGLGEQESQEPPDRVRAHTAPEINRKIDQEIDLRIRAYSQLDGQAITRRIAELDREWDIERILEANASALAFGGVAFSLLGSKRWLLIPSLVLPFLFLHAVQGWCPPVPALRRLGVRTRHEIDREKYALKVLRGDFVGKGDVPAAEAALQAVNC